VVSTPKNLLLWDAGGLRFWEGERVIDPLDCVRRRGVEGGSADWDDVGRGAEAEADTEAESEGVRSGEG
jgi:hypothetical protein